MRIEKEPEQGRLGELPPKLREMGDGLAEKWAFDLAETARRVSKWFKGGIADRFRAGVMERLRKHGAADLTEIGLRLQIDPALRWRWEQGEVSPNWETLFLAGTAYRVVWDGALPTADLAIVSGMCHTVGIIRESLLQKQPLSCDLSSLALMRFVTAKTLWIRAEASNDPRLQERAVFEANCYVSQRTRAASRRTREEIRKSIDEWLEPYILFQVMIPFDWPF